MCLILSNYGSLLLSQEALDICIENAEKVTENGHITQHHIWATAVILRNYGIRRLKSMSNSNGIGFRILNLKSHRNLMKMNIRTCLIGLETWTNCLSN